MGNFYVYTDKDGGMPGLFYRPVDSSHHPYYVRYVREKPVECRPYPGQTRVYDYRIQEFVGIETIKRVIRP